MKQITLPFDFICPKGSYVNNFKISSGTLVNNIQVQCSDPDKTTSLVYGGPNGGNVNAQRQPLGFNTAEGGFGNFLDYLIVGDSPMFGSKDPVVDSGKKNTLVTKCDDGKVIVGIKGSASPKFFVNDIQFYCATTPLVPITPPLTPLTPGSSTSDEKYIMWFFIAAIVLGGLWFIMSKKTRKI